MAISKTNRTAASQAKRPPQQKVPVKVATCSGECRFQDYVISDVRAVTAQDRVSGPADAIPTIEALKRAVMADARFQRVMLTECKTPNDCYCQEAVVELASLPIQYRKKIENIEAFTSSGQGVFVEYKVKFKAVARLVKGICVVNPESE
jgi:hypothetical protein